jgi:hypothetical protein
VQAVLGTPDKTVPVSTHVEMEISPLAAGAKWKWKCRPIPAALLSLAGWFRARTNRATGAALYSQAPVTDVGIPEQSNAAKGKKQAFS